VKNIDTLFVNAHILTANKNEILNDGYLVVADGKILALGEGKENADKYSQAKETIDLQGNLLMPGLINTHTHSAMTIFRGLADDLPLMEWLQNYIFPVEKRLTNEWVYWGTQLACLEMIASGTTTFCDMYLFAQSVAKATKQAGMRATIGEAVYDFPSPNYGTIENSFAYYNDLLKDWQKDELINIAVTPHAPYTCSPKLLKKYSNFAKQNNLLFNIHLAETKFEIAQIAQKYNCTPVKHLHNLNILNEKVLLDHMVWIEDNDLELLQNYNTKISHNPQSNLKLASGIAPLEKFAKYNLTVGLGTDGAASNNDLDLFLEMDTAAKLQKNLYKNPAILPAQKVVQMTTIQGAKCLGLENKIGSLEIGKAADLIIIDFKQPHLQPIYNYQSHLVYCVKGSDVTSTMVNGQWLMKNREFLTLDKEHIFAEISKISTQIKQQLFQNK